MCCVKKLKGIRHVETTLQCPCTCENPLAVVQQSEGSSEDSPAEQRLLLIILFRKRVHGSITGGLGKSLLKVCDFLVQITNEPEQLNGMLSVARHVVGLLWRAMEGGWWK